jgi:hypothetical protein
MPTVTFMWFSKDDGDRVFGIAGELKRIAEDHNVAFHVRTEEEDPDPETEEEQDEPPDPVRLVEDLTLPKDVVDQLRQVATAARLHIYVHPAA